MRLIELCSVRAWCVVLAVGLSLGAASSGSAGTRAPARAGAAGRTGSCVVSQIGFAAGNARIGATASCRVNGHAVPARTTWRVEYADLSGAPCAHLGPTAGSGTSFGLPTASVWSGPVLPGIVEATFTARARAGGHALSATTTWRHVDPAAHVLCSAPPALTASPGPRPPQCRFATPPTLHGLAIRDGAVKCVGGLGQCSWSYQGPATAASFLVYSYFIDCTGRGKPAAHGAPTTTEYLSRLEFALQYRADADEATCELDPGATGGSFALPADWGPGVVQVTAAVDNVDLPSPYAGTRRWSSGSLRAGGAADACAEADPGFVAFPEAAALAGSDLTLGFTGSVAPALDVLGNSPNTSCGTEDAFTAQNGSVQAGGLAGGWQLVSPSSLVVDWTGGGVASLAASLLANAPSGTPELVQLSSPSSCPVAQAAAAQSPIGQAYAVTGTIGPPRARTSRTRRPATSAASSPSRRSRRPGCSHRWRCAS